MPIASSRRATTSSAARFSATKSTRLPSATARASRLVIVCDLPVPGGPSSTKVRPAAASAIARSWEASAGTGQPGTGRYAVIGIGVNIAPLPGEGFATPPAWLQELLPGIDAPATLARIAAPLVQTVRGFEQGGFAPLAERFAARDLLAGQAVRLSDGTEGVAQGVGPGGELRVHTPAGLREVHSAEVSVRPQALQGGG